MDLTTIIVIIALTALSFGAILWMNIYARRAEPSSDAAGGASLSAGEEQSGSS